MKLMATITLEQMHKLYPHIDCDDWAEVFEEEYVFYNPTPAFQIIMKLMEIVTYTDIPEQANKYIKQVGEQ
jgi:hypothetical protein